MYYLELESLHHVRSYFWWGGIEIEQLQRGGGIEIEKTLSNNLLCQYSVWKAFITVFGALSEMFIFSGILESWSKCSNGRRHGNF